MNLRLAKPTSEEVLRFRKQMASEAPTYPADGDFQKFRRSELVGKSPSAFDSAREALVNWRMHNMAGVVAEVVPLEPGNDVVLSTRIAGVWLLFACRIVAVADLDDRFGFTYVTLPGHPEQGEESFMAHRYRDEVRLVIEATSRPSEPLARLVSPVTRVLQKRYTDKYFEAMRTAIN